MKSIVGLILCICGVAMGVYCGLWWAFIGGIVDVITQIKAEEISALATAIGIVKIIFASFIGYACFLVLFLPGLYILKK